MRIIGGEFKGRKIEYPEFKTVRPTKDRIREAVFNMIAEWVPGARVLDLFAGSGAYGLESLSRGALELVLVDNDARCAEVIEKNVSTLKIKNKAKVLTDDVFEAIPILSNSKERFDIVFADPPFNKEMAKKTLITINHYDILNRPSLLILEHSRNEAVPEEEGSAIISRQKTYKDILISLYIKR